MAGQRNRSPEIVITYSTTIDYCAGLCSGKGKVGDP